MKTLYNKIAIGLLTILISFSFPFNVTAQTGASINFDGIDDNIQIPSFSFGTNWTAEAWVRPTFATNGNWNVVLGQSFWNNTQGFVIAVSSGSLFINSPGVQGVNISTPITNNAWTHVAATYNNGIYAFYKNGILIATQAASFANSTTPFFIGMRRNNANSALVDPFEGYIDEVRVWNTTRSQCDIQSYMNCEIPGNATNLLANYHFNQGTAGGLNLIYTLNDATTNSNDGTLNNFPPLLFMIGSTSNWVAPSPFASGFSTPTIPSPEINIRGNSISILDGDVTPSITDNTNFNGAGTRTFVIENTGTQTLNAGVPYLTGTNASEFSITLNPSSVVAASTGTTSFVVAFTPTSLGVKSATVNIYNNDCSEPIYDFVITSTAVTAGALNFDGVNDFVETGANLAELAQSDFCIEAWIKTTGTSEAIVTCANANTTWEAGEKCFYIDGSGTPIFVGWGNNYIVGNIAVNNGVWHHVAVVWDYLSGISGTGKLYVDGVDQTGAVSYVANYTNIGTFKIGLTNYNVGEAQNNFNGEIDEVRIWNRVLCQPEIVNNMNCELPTPASQTGLNGYYKFNSGIAFGTNTTITSASDAAVFGNNGTLTNFSLTGGTTSNWVNLGGVTSGSTCSAYLDPEINLRGNGISILNNDITPSITDNTDFGIVLQGSIISKTFVIQNLGTAALSVSAYSLSGTNASEFTITTNPAASIGAAGSSTLVISYSATTLGLKSASLTIVNNDCDEGVYRFEISASCVTAAAALNFDGLNDVVNIPHNTLLNITNSITIESWIKTTVTSEQFITSKYDDSWYLAVSGGTPNSGKASFYLNGPAPLTWLQGTTVVSDGNWHHVVGTYDGSYMKLFVDGNLDAQVLKTASLSILTGTNPLQIGARSNGWVFQGSIDEVRVWNTARSQCEIQSYMNCEIPSTSAGLILNYHFNQGAAAINNSTVTSLIEAANGLNGALSSFSLNGTTSNWIAPGGVVSNYTSVISPSVEIDVRGNGNSILDGNTGTSALDFTSFNGALTRTFTIHNTISGGTLNIGTPYLTGANASQFTVLALPASSIAGIGSTSFVVAFTPTSLGAKSATLNITSNDCSEPVYDFVITATAVTGEALNFDGLSNVVAIPGILDPQITNYSLECWFKMDNNVARPTLFKHIATTGTGRSHLYVNSTTSLLCSNTCSIPLIGTTTLSTGQWYHAAYTWDGTTRKMYLNGNLEASDSNNPLEPSTGSLWRIGVNSGGNYFDGDIDEVRFWNTTRTQCEIQDHMHCEIPTTATGLLANFHFNQGIAGGTNTTVTQLMDATGTFTGNLNNFTLTGISSNWTSPGGVVSGSNCPIFNYPEIAVQGSTTTIVNGSTLPNPADLTLFNNAFLGTSYTNTFVIYNTGTASLTISNYSLSGINASDFSITSIPSASVASSGSTSIVVTFSPLTIGVKSATLNIISNDCDETPFSFAIEGKGMLPGAALNFDGVNDRVTVNDFNLGTSDFTMETWIQPTAFSVPDMYILSNRLNNFGATGNWFNLAISSNKFQIELGQASASSNTVFVGTSNLSANNWYHVAVVRSGLEYRLYVNGLLETSVTDASSRNLTGNYSYAHIGGWPENGTGRWFNGNMDELRVWNVARTQCEIQSYMNTQINVTGSGLIANYHFNEGLVNSNNAGYPNLPDFSGSSNTGTLTSFALTSTVSNWVIPGAVLSGVSAPSVPTASILISGNSQSITPGSVSTSTSNFTDFGTALSRTFVIQSSGGGTMYINAPVTLSGGNAGDFTITSQPSSSITTGTTNFVVNFIPTAIGTRTAIVNVNSSDCTSPNYSFVITASATTGAALHFDGLNDNASTPVFNTITNEITLQAKVFWNGTTSSNQVVVYNGNTSLSGYGFFVGAASSQIFLLYGAINTLSLNYNLTPNQWTYLTLVIQTNKVSFYANGVLTTTVNPSTIGVPNTPVGAFVVGANNIGSENFYGMIDEVLLWSRALTQCEIQAYSICEIATSASSLVANYHFNQGIAGGTNSTVSILADATGNGNNLTLTNFNLSGITSNWISPGAVVSGSSCPVFTAPEINIIGNGLSILDDDYLPSTSDDTDFGNISSNSNVVQTFTIENVGLAPLSILSISLSGASASSFSISALNPISPIASGSFAVFNVSFAPASSGSHSAILTVTNNDCDESTYDFAITGTALVGTAFNFDGTNDFINIGNILTQSYTKEAWIQLSASSNGNNILSSGSGTIGTALWAPGINGYKLSSGHNLNWNAVQDPNPLTLGTWYHVAVTYDAASNLMTLYKNGISVSSNTVIPFTGGDALSIGAFSGSFVTTGSMDEVRIWNRPLCQAEIQNNMTCEIPTTAMGLIGNYHFNQGVGNGQNTITNLLTDASGANNTGTITNAALTGTISNWTSTSTITTGSSCTAYLTPEIDLIGNGISINDGDITPSLTDYTDFGGICINTTVVRTFTIQNTGNTTLTVSGLTLSGTNASDFTISAINPASPIPTNSLSVFSITFNPTTSGIKTATVNITNSDCNENPYDFVITGTCNALPVVVANSTNSVICNTFSTSVFGTGANTYTWSGGVTNNIAFTPSTNVSYTVTGTNTLTGCTSTNLAVQSITVNPNPTITASQSNSIVCFGVSSDLNASGASSYTWEPGSLNNASVNVTPSITTTYSVSGTSSAGCVANNTVMLTLTVNPLPLVSASTSNSVICMNYSTSVFGAGADTYTWTGGVTNGLPFTPTSTQSYTVNGTNTLTGCTSTNSAVQTITVNSLPTVLASTNASVICEGFATTLNATGANSYTWNPGSLTGSSINITPNTSTDYTLTGTNLEGCTNTNVAVQTISVNTLPTVSASISNSSVCFGNTVSLSGSGASTYTWSNGINDNTSFTPSVNANYTVNGTNLAGCTNTNLATVSVTVYSLPSLSVLVRDSVICLGDTTNLIASGALTFSWSGGITNGIDFSPTITNSYTVIATDLNSCENSAISTITVNSLPTLTISSTQNPACVAQSQTLSVTGATSYTWNTQATTSSISYTPLSTSSFSVMAIDSNGCANTAQFNQEVMSCEITVFTGITANNDGLNDVLTIQNIESFPENKVTVFNRWGKEVFSMKGYNNLDKAWPLPEDVSKLTPTTYFYIIDLGDGSKPIKGWVELIKN